MSTTETIDPRVAQRVGDLAVALEEQRLAQLREEDATPIAAEEAEVERLARIKAVAAALPAQLESAGIAAAEKKLVAAIGTDVDAVAAYSEALGTAWSELSRGEPLPAGFAAKIGNGSVMLNGTNYPQRDAQAGIIALARMAISAKFPRMALRLNAT
jgi:hypothetical protein